jgi:hypothetical protein
MCKSDPNNQVTLIGASYFLITENFFYYDSQPNNSFEKLSSILVPPNIE